MKNEFDVSSWMPLWLGDYLADTQHLTRDEHGAYLLLIMGYWRAGGVLQDDDRRLASIAKASAAEWRRLRPVLAAFFELDGGCWRHARTERELSKARHQRSIASARAQQAANKRWGDSRKQCSEHAPGIAQAMLEQCPSPSPSPNTAIPPIPPEGADGDFDRFWDRYPRKVGKKAALKAWRRLAPDRALADRLLDAVTTQAKCEQWMREEGRFVPHPSTWLTGARWEDSTVTTTPVQESRQTDEARRVLAQKPWTAEEREAAQLRAAAARRALGLPAK